MQNFLLSLLVLSLTANLVQIHLLRRKKAKEKQLIDSMSDNKRTFLIILAGIVSEAVGSMRVDDFNVRLFAYNRPHHQKAIAILSEHGMVDNHFEGALHSSAVIKSGVA